MTEQKAFYKQMVIDAVVGAGFPSMKFAELAERRLLAAYCGERNSPAWEWCRDELEKCKTVELVALYTKIKELKDAPCQ